MNVTNTFEFNPDRVAYAEAHGWRAYYDRDWVTLLRLIVEMCQSQFRIPFPMSLLAAYYATRASIAWVPLDHDEAKVQAFYEQFYRLARRYAGLSFDPARAAALELRYNEVHRRLSIEKQTDKTEFIEAMVQLHSELFGLTPEQARESAEWRVMANNVVDTITGKASTDPEADWARLEDYLRRCYRSIATELSRMRVVVLSS
jgi:hypothetical protein